MVAVKTTSTSLSVGLVTSIVVYCDSEKDSTVPFLTFRIFSLEDDHVTVLFIRSAGASKS